MMSIGASRVSSVGKARSAALLNEYKGVLFEFLVAKSLNQYTLHPQLFWNEITDDLLGMINVQEQYLRDNYPYLLDDLPQLAERTALYFIDRYPHKINSLRVVGKKVSGNFDQRSLAEADILLNHNGGEDFLGLKLSKSLAYVNTKSGGIRSFIQRYFGEKFPKAYNLQEEFNKSFDHAYASFAYALNESEGIGGSESFEVWQQRGLPLLPGQLTDAQKELCHKLYAKLACELYHGLAVLYKESHLAFADCLKTLIGLSSENSYQLTCFYKNINQRYHLDKTHYFCSNDLSYLLQNYHLADYREKKSSLDVILNKAILQIRIKPMNTFINRGFKINCSLKLKY